MAQLYPRRSCLPPPRAPSAHLPDCCSCASHREGNRPRSEVAPTGPDTRLQQAMNRRGSICRGGLQLARRRRRPLSEPLPIQASLCLLGPHSQRAPVLVSPLGHLNRTESGPLAEAHGRSQAAHKPHQSGGNERRSVAGSVYVRAKRLLRARKQSGTLGRADAWQSRSLHLSRRRPDAPESAAAENK